jgi:hypothetical protein
MEKNENKWLVGYKTVRMIGKELKSCSSKYLKVRYISGKVAKPRTFGGPLSVFSNKYDAIGFIGRLENPEKCRVYRCMYLPTSATEMFRYAEGMIQTRKLEDCPRGTILARRVKITKKIF